MLQSAQYSFPIILILLRLDRSREVGINCRMLSRNLAAAEEFTAALLTFYPDSLRVEFNQGSIPEGTAMLLAVVSPVARLFVRQTAGAEHFCSER
jgi:hypothetical protein